MNDSRARSVESAAVPMLSEDDHDAAPTDDASGDPNAAGYTTYVRDVAAWLSGDVPVGAG